MEQGGSLLSGFVEMPLFTSHLPSYLDDDSYAVLQEQLKNNPEAGDLIEGTGGLRKVRFADQRRGKGKRSGLRVIYYYWQVGSEFWLFAIYDKNEVDDLTPQQKKVLKAMIKHEVEIRRVQR